MRIFGLNIDKRQFVMALAFFIAASASAHGNLQFVNGNWYDGTRFVQKTMWSVDGVFRESFDGKVDQTVDLHGGFAIPPFAEAHTHDFTVPDPRDVSRYLAAGIFYAKNDNSLARLVESVRPMVNTPESVDVTWALGGLTITGGHPTQIYDEVAKHMNMKAADMVGEAYWLVDSAADLDRQWNAILARKPDFIKVYLEGKRGLNPEIVPDIVRRAHAAGLRVAAHIATAADYRNALNAGVDEITHLPLEKLTAEDAARAAKLKVWTVTTTLSHRSTDGFADVEGTFRHNLKLLQDAGAPIAFGTDAGKTVVDEIENIRRLGVFDDRTLLRIALQETPKTIFPARKIGRIAEGYEASFLLLKANPLENFAAIRDIALRVKTGHALAAPKQQLTEQQINAVGYALLQRKKVDAAVDVFRLNVELFPNSANVYDSLGEALRAKGDEAGAVENYKKAEELLKRNGAAPRH